MKEIIETKEEVQVVELKDFTFNDDKFYVIEDDDFEYYILAKMFVENAAANYNFVGLTTQGCVWDEWQDADSLFENIFDVPGVRLYEFYDFNEFFNYLKQEYEMKNWWCENIEDNEGEI